jgi:hypothetical protein
MKPVSVDVVPTTGADERSSSDVVAVPPPIDDVRIRHVVAMQLQLMEDTFYTLRLDRYANAPDNSGWVNLFRRWANSSTFQRHASALQTTFSREFMHFYRHYLEGGPRNCRSRIRGTC